VFLVGVVSAAVFGFLAIGFMLRYLQKNSVATFVWYRLAFGLIVLAAAAFNLRP
jgi:undecaprenyl-diphosphatase